MGKSIKIGKTEFVLAGFADYTKAQFKAEFKGKLSEDLDATWKLIEAARPRKKKATKAKSKSE